MDKETQERKARLGFEWILSKESGVTYLCPIGSIHDKSKVTDEQLQQACIDESQNPQND